MEVIVHDVKPEYIISSDLGNNSDCETQRLSVSPNPLSQQHYSPSRLNNNSGGGASKSNTVLNHHLTSGGGILSATTSSPVRTSTTTASGQNLQTMAKSSGLSIVHVTLPQTVIQSPSVIQSASGQLQFSKGNVILLPSNPKQSNSSVIQTAGGGLQNIQIIDSHHSDDSLSNDGVEHPVPIGQQRGGDRRRREILTRRPSYRKILSDLGGAEITGGDKGGLSTTSESSQDAADVTGGGRIIVGEYNPQSMVKVVNANNLGLSGVSSADASSGPATTLQTITMTNAGTAGGTIVQYAQSQDGQQFFVPVGVGGGELQAYTLRPVSSASSSPSVVLGGSSGHVPEEATRKREIRLLKNREAARECRRKKKEYIKCLENRVAVLENQNKALIDELKSLKELYCQQKTE